MQLVFINLSSLRKSSPNIYSYVLYLSSPEFRDHLGPQWEGEIRVMGSRRYPHLDWEDDRDEAFQSRSEQNMYVKWGGSHVTKADCLF